MSIKKSGGICSTLGYVLLMAMVWLGYIIYGVYQTHWINVHKLTPDDFRMAPNITVLPVPTTYYSLKNISEVIPKWHHDFHLYRLADPEDLGAFMVPIETLEGNVRAKQIDHNCKRESVICWPCFEEGVTNIPIKNVRKQRNWYASFARIPDELIAMLTKRISLPFPIEISKVEHAFISNLEKPMITAPIHGAPMLSSMAITFLGHKTWLVFPPDDYLSDEGIGCKPAATTMLPLHSPRGNFKMYVYHAMPGDIMFFSENWGHTVYTHPGPNMMVNFRSFELGNIWRNPVNWWTACFNFFLLGKSIKYSPGEKVEKDDTKIQVIPEKFLNLHAAKVLEGTCPDGKISEFDQQLMDILKTSAGQFWDSVKGRYEEDEAPTPAAVVEEKADAVVEDAASVASVVDEAVTNVAAAVEEGVAAAAEAVENQMAEVAAAVDEDPLPEPVAEGEPEIVEPIKEMEIEADSVAEEIPVETETQNEL